MFLTLAPFSPLAPGKPGNPLEPCQQEEIVTWVSFYITIKAHVVFLSSAVSLSSFCMGAGYLFGWGACQIDDIHDIAPFVAL